jgi:hypothetical protein
MKIKSGGGITSNKLLTSKGYKTEPVPPAVSPAGVAQQGMATQFRKEELYQGKGYQTGPQQSTGIARATFNSAKAGPGSGRTIYASGSQSPTPTPKPVGPTRDTLAEFGPKISGPSRRR